MTITTVEDPRLTQLREICAAYPEADASPVGRGHTSFNVRKHTFAYFLNNHHGDGIVSVCFKAPPGENEELVSYDPKRFYLPAYIGARGWSGMRLDLGRVKWSQVTVFVERSYRLVAPKRLVAVLDERTPETGRRRADREF